MTDIQLNKREEDIQRLIIAGVNKLSNNLVPFRRKKLFKTNEKICLGKD
jgi:hypothetical protein